MNMFNKAFDRVIGHEGGFTDDPDDRGNWTGGAIGVGELKGTKFGLSAMTYPDVDIKNLTVEQAKVIYKRDWWDKIGLDKMRPAMQYQFFDAAINHGTHNAAKMLQRAVDAFPDGIIGPNTMANIKATDLNDLLMLFLAERIEFYTNIKTFDKYGKGWTRRIAGNLRLAAEDN
jgi:lysozyme family protein